MIKKIDNGKNNKIEIRSDKIQDATITINGDNNTIIIEEEVIVKSKLTISTSGNNTKVHIKKNTSFEQTSISVADDDNYVIIGNDCMFALGTSILASDYHSIIDSKTGKRTNISRGVNIGNHVWVASRAMILKNTKIGNDCIVSAGAIVSGKYADGLILGGVPSKILKEGITWSRDLLKNSEVVVPKEIKEADIEFNIEDMLSENNKQLTGWAFCNSIENLKSELVFCVIDNKQKKHYYPGYKYNSDDVEEYYQNSDFRCSRFKTFINISLNNIKEIILIMIYKEEGYSKIVFKNDKNRK